MFSFVIYELKVAAVLAVFYLCFKCFLCREKMHRVNRIVIVLSAILSFVLPLCIITLHKTVPMPEVVIDGGLMTMDETVSPASAISSAGMYFRESLTVATYWAGVLFVLGSLVLGVVRVVDVIKGGDTREIYGSKVIVCDRDVSPFSWIRWIVMSESDFKSGNHHILEHEKAHIRLGHSKEVMLFDVMSAFQWFNPAMWLLKRDLRAIHEYEADDAVLRNGADIREYQYSLIRKAVSASGYSITNSFNHSILKNRITMMSKSNASRTKWLRALYILPLVCGALVLNARTVTDYKVCENTAVATDDGSIIRIELKKDGEGGYRFFVMDKNVTFDELFDIIIAMMNGDKSAVVEIVAPADCPSGVIDDIKEGLRKISALKIQYRIPNRKGYSVFTLCD